MRLVRFLSGLASIALYGSLWSQAAATADRTAEQWLADAKKNVPPPPVSQPNGSITPPEAYARIAAALIEHDRMPEAREFLAAVPDASGAGQKLRQQTYFRAATCLVERGQVEKAIGILHLPGTQPDSERFAFRDAFAAAMEANRLDDALKIADAAPDRDESNRAAQRGDRASLLAALAERWADMGDRPKADEIYQRIPQKVRDSHTFQPPPFKTMDVHQGPAVIANWWASYGDFDKALQSAQGVTDNVPGSRGDMYARIAIQMARRGRIVEARKSQKMADRDAPRPRDFFVGVPASTALDYAEARARIGDRPGARSMLDAYLNLPPALGDPAVYREFSRAMQCLLLLDDSGRALTLVEHHSFRDSRGEEWFAFGMVPYYFALTGHAREIAAWVAAVNGPESPENAYALACVGMAEGLMDRDAKSAKAKPPTPAVK